MLNIFLAADGDARPEDLAVVWASMENELQVLGLAHTVMAVEPIEVPEACRDGGFLQFECFQKQAYYSLADRLVMDRIARGSASLDQARYVHVTLTPARIHSEKGVLFGATDWVDSMPPPASLVRQTWCSLLSTAWLEGQAGLQRERLIRRLTQHELGHALGLVPTGREDSEEKYGTHCTRVCVMRQGESVIEFLSLAREEDRLGTLFCELCFAYCEDGF